VLLVALVAGGMFLSFSIYQINTSFGGNPSGPLLISRTRFVPSPASARADVRSTIRLIDGVGGDGQFFYFIAFDPFLAEYRNTPERYSDFIDAPPYRYGRIGFSLLTRLLSSNRPTRYPVTMVALVIVGLAACAAWLAAIARQHGRSPRYGALVLLVPGFWRTAEGALPEPLALACILAAFWCVHREKWWPAGVLLGASMLIRETSGGLVLALAAGLLFNGKRRPCLIVTALAFLPIVAWKVFVASVFWTSSGLGALMTTPNNAGLPFAGMWHLWTLLGRGEFYPAVWEMARGAMVYPILIIAAIAMAVWAAANQRSAASLAALFYAALTIIFNYDGVWLHLGSVERLTIDLFVALALVFVQLGPVARRQRVAFTLFWTATAWYVFFMTFEASQIRESLFRNLVGPS
jgi:hypothetical protein